MTSIAPTFNNFLQNGQNSIIYQAYTSCYTTVTSTDSTNPITGDTLNKMLGFQSSSQVLYSDFVPGSISIALNFWSFWNTKTESYYSDLGRDFKSISSISLSSQNTAQIINVKDFNTICTYMLMLMFVVQNGLGNYYTINLNAESVPPNIFSNTNKFPGLKNMRAFIANAGGLGNYSINSTSDSGVTLGTVNEGFISTYCSNTYNTFCEQQKLIGNACIEAYRKKVSNTPLAANFCGCFTPQSSFAVSAINSQQNGSPVKKIDGSSIPNIRTRACDSFCNTLSSIKLFTATDGPAGNQDKEIECNSTVCIINNNNISVNNSQVSVNFNQICPCEENHPCTCVIESNIPGLLDNVSDGQGKGMTNQTNFTQRCNNAICYKIDGATGNSTEIPCNPINTPQTGSVFQKNTDGMSLLKDYTDIGIGFWLVISAISIIITLVIIAFIFIKIF